MSAQMGNEHHDRRTWALVSPKNICGRLGARLPHSHTGIRYQRGAREAQGGLSFFGPRLATLRNVDEQTKPPPGVRMRSSVGREPIHRDVVPAGDGAARRARRCRHGRPARDRPAPCRCCRRPGRTSRSPGVPRSRASRTLDGARRFRAEPRERASGAGSGCYCSRVVCWLRIARSTSTIH